MTDLLEINYIKGFDLFIYNKIINTFYEKLLKIETYASSVCTIQINEILFENTKNCNIMLENKCLTNSESNLNLFLESIIENSIFFSEELRLRLENNLGIVLDPSIDQSNKGFLKKCKSKASVSNSININKLLVKNCYNDKEADFRFYNMGDASSNCGNVELLNALYKKNVDEKEEKNI